GRDETVSDNYDDETTIFGASGGASLFRVSMLRQIGVFDQDFFAYYEDIDMSFRGQLAGWKVGYVPTSIAYHGQGVTSGRMGNGFTTMQYVKNTPFIIIKDVPGSLLVHILPRFLFAYSISLVKALCNPSTTGAPYEDLARCLP